MYDYELDPLSTKAVSDEEYAKIMMPSNGDEPLDEVMKNADFFNKRFYDISDFLGMNDGEN
jgi:hypothetical protein